MSEANTDADSKRVLLHAGTHKTGTTSLQLFLRDQNPWLLHHADAHYPDGFAIPTMHAELPLIAVRPERTWPARIRFPETQNPRWLAAAERHVRHEIDRASPRWLVYSHEDLSYLRSPDEFERLRRLLAPRHVSVVIVLRAKNDFLRSYADQLRATGFEPSDDPTSFAYLAADSWLVDYDALVDGYCTCFGGENVTVLDYDERMRADGSVIPAVTDLLSIPRASMPPVDGYFLNTAGAQLRPNAEQLAAIRQRIVEQSR